MLASRNSPPWERFVAQTEAHLARTDRPGPRILELGTRRWGPDPTHHKAMFAWAADYVLCDFMDGVDVDVVADIHELDQVFEPGSFDAVICCSVLEHVERPWIAVEQMCQMLTRPESNTSGLGGGLYVQTHQTFPLHGYPTDFFRFSDRALESMVPDGFEVETSFAHPCKIVPTPPVEPWNTAPDVEAWLNVDLCAIAG